MKLVSIKENIKFVEKYFDIYYKYVILNSIINDKRKY